ncbi:MAG: hypothetical protein JXR96_27020 [Deltaproteobacteria bacterium]|nr:hypothetical protein [Deltaproteobacteria bacterium]
MLPRIPVNPRRLRCAAAARGLPFCAIEARLGLAGGLLTRWAQAASVPAGRLEALAEVLGCDAAWLCDDDQEGGEQ